MKIKGQRLSAPSVAVIPVIRNNEEYIFQVQPVLDYTDFETLCPHPKAPILKKPSGEVSDVTDPAYIKLMEKWAQKMTSWMMIKSLEATEGLEWETVKLNEPDTWVLWDKELMDSGLTARELNKLVLAIMDVCGLNEAKVEEARQRFLASRAQEPGK